MINCPHWSPTEFEGVGLCAIGKGAGRPSAGVCRFCLSGGNVNVNLLPNPPPPSGPGTELKALLATLGIKPSGCGCNSHARQMDRMGADWCAGNIETITGWLETEAKKRGWWLPFSPFGAKLLVRLAIRKARNASAATATTESSPFAP